MGRVGQALRQRRRLVKERCGGIIIGNAEQRGVAECKRVLKKSSQGTLNSGGARQETKDIFTCMPSEVPS